MCNSLQVENFSDVLRSLNVWHRLVECLSHENLSSHTPYSGRRFDLNRSLTKRGSKRKGKIYILTSNGEELEVASTRWIYDKKKVKTGCRATKFVLLKSKYFANIIVHQTKKNGFVCLHSYKCSRPLPQWNADTIQRVQAMSLCPVHNMGNSILVFSILSHNKVSYSVVKVTGWHSVNHDSFKSMHYHIKIMSNHSRHLLWL